MNQTRKTLAAVLLVFGCGLLGYLAAAWADGPPVQTIKVVKVSARRYEFTPSTLTLKKGQSVDLELSSSDVVMSFSVPDLNQRATIPPGQVTHLRLTPQKVGSYPFLCDVFCGSGHEDMNGSITVVE